MLCKNAATPRRGRRNARVGRCKQRQILRGRPAQAQRFPRGSNHEIIVPVAVDVARTRNPSAELLARFVTREPRGRPGERPFTVAVVDKQPPDTVLDCSFATGRRTRRGGCAHQPRHPLEQRRKRARRLGRRLDDEAVVAPRDRHGAEQAGDAVVVARVGALTSVGMSSSARSTTRARLPARAHNQQRACFHLTPGKMMGKT